MLLKLLKENRNEVANFIATQIIRRKDLEIL